MRNFLSLMLLLLGASATLAQTKPNVVLIVADDLGWADLGCYRSTYHKTPNLDRLAGEGVRFTNAYAACPVCSPTRCALMTGLYPARVGITDWLPGRADRPDQKLSRPKLVTDLPADLPNLATTFKSSGYVTGMIGKWHLGGADATPQKRGFDFNVAGDHTGTPLSYFAPYAAKDRTIPGLETAPKGEYLTDRLAEEAEKFIEAHKAKPFFLYLPHYAPHTPMRAKQELIAKYKQGSPGQQGNPIYAAMLESLDDAVGRVLKAIGERGLADNTIVIFTSDNGGLATTEGPNTPPTINSPLREGKGWLYEGGIRVPLIVKWPGKMKAGTVSDAVTSSVDLLPTLVDGLGLKPITNLDGKSFLPALLGEKTDRGAIYWHYPHYANQGGKPGGAILSNGMKLIEYFENGRRELFDIAKDQSENRNLAMEKPELVKSLGEQLEAWRKQVGAKMPTPNAAYVPNPASKDGQIVLHARSAEVHGVTLRYEPLPHKSTLGFWVRVEDYATWELTAPKAGVYKVEVLQGCGKGHGGSEVDVRLGSQVLSFIVEDTGHFQNFKPREIGTIKLAEGRQTLEIRPKTKKAGAVMDVRQITLYPVK